MVYDVAVKIETTPMPRSTQATLRRPPKRRRSLSFELRVTLIALLGGLPAIVLVFFLMWSAGFTARSEITLAVVILGFWLGCALSLRERVVRPLQTVSNLIAALRESDYSVRARRARHDDALGEVMLEVNAFSEDLRERRLGSLEATALLRTVMAEIDVAVFAFDNERRLKLVNRAGEELLAQPSVRLLGRSASELRLEGCLDLDDESNGTPQMVFPGGIGRWEVRRSTFREHGIPHQLLVLTNLSRTLREEERSAWQRLVRVLGHELNNSLAPIKSIAASLANLLGREPIPDDWKDDMSRGLGVISSRAESLTRFMDSYSRLARLPAPRFASVNVEELISRVARLETRIEVKIIPGPSLQIQADSDQLEQLLINLLRNAVDAALETSGKVELGWSRNGSQIEIVINDEGPGLASTSNLFVPFFTTKPEGSGIGLVLCRQIAEAHGGGVTLENRRDSRGCKARLRLPV
jgi:nitrogen fixation/metabolism regulation signal transduction histidine kinase